MRFSIRLLTAAWLALLAVSMATGSATANRSLSIEGETRITLTGPLTIVVELAEVICNATLIKTLSRSFPKTEETLVGTVTELRTASCRGTGLLVFRSLTMLGIGGASPWHLLYKGFLGRLPSIAGDQLRVERVQLLLETSVLGAVDSCLYEGTVEILEEVSAEVVGRLGTISGAGSELPLRTTLRGLCVTRLGIRASLTPTQTTKIILLDLPPGDWVVAVGDSAISGESGHWAGNTSTLSSSSIMALREEAYIDEPEGVEETISGCHRSLSAEIYIGTLNGKNLACSGAKTESFYEGSFFKPGLDFTVEGEDKGQAQLLKEFAERHRAEIKLVAISIGANDFEIGTVTEACATAFLNRAAVCKTERIAPTKITPATILANTAAIEAGILRIRRAMEEAGYANGSYTIVVQDYASPVPHERELRYPPTLAERESGKGGCPFYNEDVDWMNETVLPEINGAVWTATAAAATAARIPIVRMELVSAFNGRRLCETGVDQLRTTGIRSWTQARAIDETEWITRFGTPAQLQESFHPDYWAQLALRNCLRLAYNNGRTPIEGSCTIRATGMNGFGEPQMDLR